MTAEQFVSELSAPFAPVLTNVLKQEGGYTCNTKDAGNFYKGKLTCTNKGITGGAFYNYYKKEPTQEIIKGLTVDQVKPIYKKNYWDKINGDRIANESVADLMMFVVVNSGTGQISELKRIANQTAGKKIFAETDSAFTNQEADLFNALPQDIFHKNLKTSRANFYKALVQAKPANGVFLKGWLSRLDKFVYSGKTTAKSYTWLWIGGSVLLVGGVAAYVYKNRSGR